MELLIPPRQGTHTRKRTYALAMVNDGYVIEPPGAYGDVWLIITPDGTEYEMIQGHCSCPAYRRHHKCKHAQFVNALVQTVPALAWR